MADYRITRMFTALGGESPLIDRLAGPGWADTAERVIDHIVACRHRFFVVGDGDRLWLAVRTDPLTGARALVFAGGPVALTDLPIEWGDARPAPPMPARKPGFFARLRRSAESRSRA